MVKNITYNYILRLNCDYVFIILRYIPITMINKRLLIKNLLANIDENSFFDKKQKINLHLIDGKAKFLKHICALSNSNPYNNSYIIVGVEDGSNALLGVDFYDDSHLQNLVNAYLENAPIIRYENVVFPSLPPELVIGLVTIAPKKGKCFFKKKIHIVEINATFSRIGSISHPEFIYPKVDNSFEVHQIEKASTTQLKNTLDNFIYFLTIKHPNLNTQYHVFQEYYTVCWAGIEKKKKGRSYLSRVDIELINEDLKIFYSALDEVEIFVTENEFTIVEYIRLGYKKYWQYIPFSVQKIKFNENMTYSHTSEIVFKIPEVDKKHLHHLYNYIKTLLEKYKANLPLNFIEKQDLHTVCYTLLLCHLHGFKDAIQLLISYKEYFKNKKSINLYTSFKEVMRILRKLKYETNHE